MSGLIIFDKIGRDQLFRSGTFNVTMGGLYDRYLDHARAPKLATELLLNCYPYLAGVWPEKYPHPEQGHGNKVLVTKYFTVSDLAEWLRAVTVFISDANRGDVDQNLGLREGREPKLVGWLEEQSTLLQAEISARSKLTSA